VRTGTIPVEKKIALLLQGEGALAAFQCGAWKAILPFIRENGHELVAVAGASARGMDVLQDFYPVCGSRRCIQRAPVCRPREEGGSARGPAWQFIRGVKPCRHKKTMKFNMEKEKHE
jgi:hypothetical protein